MKPARPVRLLLVVATAATMLAALLGPVPHASAAPSSQRSTGVDLPDPGFLKTPGYRSGGGPATQLYMLYGTGDGGSRGAFPVRYRTGDFKGTYRASASAYAMRTVPGWVGREPKFGRRLWAPTVFVSYQSEDRYTYVMYFSAWHKNRLQSCIGTATSSSPFGPFVEKGGPFCPPDGAKAPGDSRKPEAIDPTNYRDSAGRNYLLYKTSVANEKRWTVWALRMDASGVRKERGAVVKRVKEFPAKAENPALVRRGSTLWMFVSEDNFSTCDYRTAAWKASSLAGPWTKVNGSVLSRGTTGGLCGPGGASIISDGGAHRIAYHAWKDPANPGEGARRTYVATLRWNSAGNPYVA